MIELLVSIAILGMVSIGFLGALMTGYISVRLAHDQTMAQNLTRSAMENVATASFPVASDNEQVDAYDVVVTAVYVDGDRVESEDPTEIQLVTVTVQYHETGRTIKETQCVKVM
jgi:type II secretory pathway pseudopilin PulG